MLVKFQFLAYLLYDLLSNDYNNEVDTINQKYIGLTALDMIYFRIMEFPNQKNIYEPIIKLICSKKGIQLFAKGIDI